MISRLAKTNLYSAVIEFERAKDSKQNQFVLVIATNFQDRDSAAEFISRNLVHLATAGEATRKRLGYIDFVLVVSQNQDIQREWIICQPQ